MPTVRLPKRFTFVRELGRGGMGAVYEVIDTESGGRVALKTLPSHDPLAISRFKQEFRSLQDIHHPNLVALGELFCEQGEWAFSMDLIEGTDLLEYLRPSRRGEALPTFLSELDTANLPPLPPVSTDRARASLRPSLRPSPMDDAAGEMPRAVDEGRLRGAFAQLALGLSALHAAGKIHRDIKPSNIRVRPDGQLVLLDFGLVANVAAEGGLTGTPAGMGTPAYVAPEQAAGEDLGPAADWYAVGVVLFQALSERLPFEGTLLQVIRAKQTREAPRVRSLAPHVSADLDELCAALLARHPADRPTGEAVRRHFAQTKAGGEQARVEEGAGHASPLFVGRADQLAVLSDAFARTQRGEPACVILEGESGTGKSFLARRFLDQLVKEHRQAMIISGRCYENEAVPYNAWDGAIESLVKCWLRLEAADASELLPVHASSLAQTFPSLRRVPCVDHLAAPRATLDPREVRARAFTALRQLFERASQRAPLIVFLDDLQWADHDSVGLLGEVLREPGAPPFLFVATARPLKDYPEVERELGAVLPRAVVRCNVAQLPHEQAVELAAQLLSRSAPELQDQAESIANEARGHALFVTELVRHVTATGRAPREALSLEEALWTRVLDLSPEARALLAVLSLAARPLPEAVALRAADVDPTFGPRVLSALRVGHLTRSSRIDRVEWLETYHDRVRSAVVERTSPERRARLFKALATAVEASAEPDANMLADFWRGAGDTERAGRYAREAGDSARGAAAFDRAAALYAVALESPSCTDSERHELLVLLGETLAQAGSGEEAAAAFLQAAEGGRDGDEQIELERKAGSELLRAGKFEAGITVTRRLFTRLGQRWPRTAFEALVTFVVLRILIALPWVAGAPRSESSIARRALTGLDVYYDLGRGLSLHDTVRSLLFFARFRWHALRIGERRRMCLSLVADLLAATATAPPCTPSELRKLRERILAAQTFAEQVARPYERAVAVGNTGASLTLAGLYSEAATHLDRSIALFREECTGGHWEIVLMQFWLCIGFMLSGRFARLSEEQSRAMQDAADLRHLQGTLQMSLSYASFAYLVRDDPEGGRRAVRQSLAVLPKGAFTADRHYALFARSNLELYEGAPERALALVEREWPALRRSLLRKAVPGVHFDSSWYRARLNLACAEVAPSARGPLLARAKRWMHDLSKAHYGIAPATAKLVAAGIANVEGDAVRAASLLREVIPEFVAKDRLGDAAVARRALGKLLKGEEGAALVREGEEYLRVQTVKNIPALCRCLAPGFSSLE